MKHSHYAVIGGFSIIPGEINYSTSYSKRMTITPNGLEFLGNLNIELVSNISQAEICDKGNTNGLGKALFCLQAFWFCIQCVTRLCQGLETSLLELNTFCHAICALRMYLLWWNKPLGIKKPTMIQAKEKLHAIALLYIVSAGSGSTLTTQL